MFFHRAICRGRIGSTCARMPSNVFSTLSHRNTVLSSSLTRRRNRAFISGTFSSAFSGSCRNPWIFPFSGLI